MQAAVTLHQPPRVWTHQRWCGKRSPCMSERKSGAKPLAVSLAVLTLAHIFPYPWSLTGRPHEDWTERTTPDQGIRTLQLEGSSSRATGLSRPSNSKWDTMYSTLPSLVLAGPESSCLLIYTLPECMILITPLQNVGSPPHSGLSSIYKP